VATVAVPSVGASPTVSLDGWRRIAHGVTMHVTHIGERFTAWLRVEDRVDRWASYGALALAVLASFAVLF